VTDPLNTCHPTIWEGRIHHGNTYGCATEFDRINLLKKLNLFCRLQAPIVRISSSLMYNVMNYYSVTNNIFQLIVDFWHMLLVNDDDDDVGFSLAFFVRFCYVLRFFGCACVDVCMIT